MNRFALALMFLLPLALPAQEKGSVMATNQSVTASATEVNILPDSENGSSVELATDTDTVSNPDPKAAQQPNAKPTQSTAPSEPAPKIPGSMVGYIDNPIVQSQIRIRFDDAFEDRFPDRSEFFYAKCACYRHAPRYSSTGPPGLRSECAWTRTGRSQEP